MQVFVADDFAAWLIGTLADAGRRRLVTWARGSAQERALRQAADAALQATVATARPEGGEDADQLALVVSQVFSVRLPDSRLGGCATLLEALQTGVAGQLAALEDPDLTGMGVSSAALLGISTAALADKLASCLVREVLADGARGGPLAALASQLNDDATHLQGQRLERMLQRLTDIVRQAPSGRRRVPIGWLISGLTSPVPLGVHKAIEVGRSDDGGMSELPVYLPRAHDETLARLIEGSQHGSKLVVLTGDSSAGKTRALWEAVRRLPPAWRLWRPADAEDLYDGLLVGSIVSQTVVWLDDAHDYLDPRRTRLAGSNADALRHLMADPERHPVLVAATMWPNVWGLLAGTADQGQEPGNAGDKDLAKVAGFLAAADHVAVPSAFQGIDLEAAKEAARQDTRLARALDEAREGRLTQYLAGALRLLQGYETASPQGRAVMDAGIDARRFGHRNQLPAELLLKAAVGYLECDVRENLPEDWAERALAASSATWRGLDGPLAPTRSRSAGSEPRKVCYQLADALEQAGSAARRYSAPPQSFWDAVADHGNPADFSQIALAAYHTGRMRNAARLFTVAGQAGDGRAVAFLASQHEFRGDRQEAERLALMAADMGESRTAMSLADWARDSEPIDLQRAQRLYRAASRAGNADALVGLAHVLDALGDHQQARTAWEEAADAGDIRALRWLANAYEAAGQHDKADQCALRMGLVDLWHVAEERDQEGNADGAERLALKAASAELTPSSRASSSLAHMRDSALCGLGQLCERAGGHAEADRLFLQVGDLDKIWRVASQQQEAGNHEGAMRLAISVAESRPNSRSFSTMLGGTQTVEGLAELCERGGRHDLADQLALSARHTVPVERLVCTREEAGNHQLADQLAIQALEQVGASPVIKLARLRADSSAKSLLRSAAAVASPWAMGDLALEEEHRGHHREAEQLATKAARGGNLFALQRLGWSRQASDPHGAKALFLMAADAGEAHALVDLARLCESNGDDVMAWQFWQAAAERGVGVALGVMSAVREREGQLDEAEDLAVKAAQAGWIDSLVRLAGIRAEAGNHDEAGRLGIEAARAAAASRTGDPAAYILPSSLGHLTDVLALLTDVRDKCRDHRGARQFARDASGVDSEYAARLNNMARDRATDGDIAEAARLYRILADIGNPQALAGLARIRAGEGDYRLAEELWLAAADAGYAEDPEDYLALGGSALRELAAMYERAQDWNSAERVHIMRVNAGETGAFLFDLPHLYQRAGDGALAARLDRFGLNADGTVSAPWRFERL